MLKANFITADEAARKVKDGDTVCSIAMTLVSVSESILKALENVFWKAEHPSNLTLLHSCGQSDRKDGIQHFAHEGIGDENYRISLGITTTLDGYDSKKIR